MDRQRQRRDRHCPNASLTTSSIFYIYIFFSSSESEHQNEVLRQEMSTMFQGQPQTYPPPPPPPAAPYPSSHGGSHGVDSSSFVSWPRPAPQGSSPSRIFGPRPVGPSAYQASMMGSMYQVSAGANLHTTPSDYSVTGYTSPSRPHPSVFFVVSWP